MKNLSWEEVQKQMYEALHSSANPEFLTEVAMPLVHQPVNLSDTKNSNEDRNSSK